MPTMLGERFARTVAARDAAGLRELLAPKVSFRALTPGNVWESGDANDVVDRVILGTWFSPQRSINEVLAVESVGLGPIDRVGYRFQVTLPDGEFIVEQQAYFKTEGNRISWLRILCSGFVDGK